MTMKEITAEKFEQRMGQPPIQDDLERCNCQEAGKLGHSSCGWNEEFDLPVFLVGRESYQIEHFRQNLAQNYPPK
jgi:hypothetical protein